MPGWRACLAALAGALLALPAAAHARAGDLDPSFGGGDGKVTLGVAAGSHEGANGMALRADGRIVLGGNTDAGGGFPNFAVVRLTAGGLPDPLFGSGGETSAHIAGFMSEGGHAVLIQPDGKPIVVGSADNNYAVARFRDPQGGFDSTFGSGGAKTGQYFNSTLGIGTAGALDPSGRILVAGDADAGAQGRNVAVARLLNPQGTPDGTFESPNGSKTYDFASDNDNASAVAL